MEQKKLNPPFKNKKLKIKKKKLNPIDFYVNREWTFLLTNIKGIQLQSLNWIWLETTTRSSLWYHVDTFGWLAFIIAMTGLIWEVGIQSPYLVPTLDVYFASRS